MPGKGTGQESLEDPLGHLPGRGAALGQEEDRGKGSATEVLRLRRGSQPENRGR